ncbi:MAG TPA: hypothetical protein VHN80_30705 [Kineosporiaceae bacterium]|nr:hypothetical protein [Kineosporiaceae bacterium]
MGTVAGQAGRDLAPETETLMLAAMAAHVAYLRETGQAVPEPVFNAHVAILDIPAA